MSTQTLSGNIVITRYRQKNQWRVFFNFEKNKFIKLKNYDNKFFSKLKNFFSHDKWNIFDILLFSTFYAAMIVRLLPIYGNVFFLGKESCYEVARVLYACDLIFWYIRILQKVSCLTFWGPKIIIIEAMVGDWLRALFLYLAM